VCCNVSPFLSLLSSLCHFLLNFLLPFFFLYLFLIVFCDHMWSSLHLHLLHFFWLRFLPLFVCLSFNSSCFSQFFLLFESSSAVSELIFPIYHIQVFYPQFHSVLKITVCWSLALTRLSLHSTYQLPLSFRSVVIKGDYSGSRTSPYTIPQPADRVIPAKLYNAGNIITNRLVGFRNLDVPNTNRDGNHYEATFDCGQNLKSPFALWSVIKCGKRTL
jgi:hypothetical protein